MICCPWLGTLLQLAPTSSPQAWRTSPPCTASPRSTCGTACGSQVSLSCRWLMPIRGNNHSCGVIRVGTARTMLSPSRPACWHRPPCLLLATTCRSQHLAPPAAPHAENGLSMLRHFPLLEDLSLRGCQQLQDGCLAHLAGLTRLARLDMRACEHLRGVVSQGHSARQTCRCVVAAAATRCAVVWMAGWGRSA